MFTRLKLPQLLVLVATMLALPSLAFGALHLVIQATGSNQGTILGESTVPGYENAIDLTSFSHSVYVPSGANGVPSGPASVSDLSVSALFDRATVSLLQAMSTNESFSSFKMELVDDLGGAKMPMVLLQYELQGGYLSSISESGSGGQQPAVSYSFSYNRVTITDPAEGTSAVYYWTPPSSSSPETANKGILLTTTPNPTHGQTEFRFSLPADSNAQLTLYDIRGYRVRDLHSGWTSSEPTVAVWDGTDDRGMKVAQGVYVARLIYPGREVTQRITVLR
jgi:type VI secretion system Hcp family effector